MLIMTSVTKNVQRFSSAAFKGRNVAHYQAHILPVIAAVGGQGHRTGSVTADHSSSICSMVKFGRSAKTIDTEIETALRNHCSLEAANFMGV
jgi:hypothetical protein